MKKLKIDRNELFADLQDHYVKMSGKELKIEFNKGADKIWKDIFDTDTQKIFYKKMLGSKL